MVGSKSGIRTMLANNKKGVVADEPGVILENNQ
jgi:hypothetical protein